MTFCAALDLLNVHTRHAEAIQGAEGSPMTRTFAAWPQPSQGRVEFTARCPCGRDAAWKQVGLEAVDVYVISCTCRSPGFVGR